MAELTSMPNEVLVDIVSCLDCRDLAGISRVSRHLNRVAEPWLYRSVSLSSWCKHGPSCFHIFLRTLLLRPALAGYVRSLNLSWNRPPARNVVEGEIATLSAAAIRVGLNDSPRLEAVQVLLILHLLPSVEVLDLLPPSYIDHFGRFMLERSLQSPAVLPIGLQSLREVRYYLDDNANDAYPSTLLVLIALPCIRVLDVCYLHDKEDTDIYENSNWGGPDVLDFTHHAGTSQLTHLRLSYGGVAPWVFQQLLPLARTLTHFSYGDRMPGGLRGFYPRGFARALMCAKATLQSLVLCFADADEGGEADHTAGTIGSLRDWPVLRSVRCSLAPLVGVRREQVVRLVDVLPLVIRSFEVDIDEVWGVEETVGEVVDMLQRKDQARLGCLAVVTVPRCWGVLQPVRELCGAAEVVLARRNS